MFVKDQQLVHVSLVPLFNQVLGFFFVKYYVFGLTEQCLQKVRYVISGSTSARRRMEGEFCSTN